MNNVSVMLGLIDLWSQKDGIIERKTLVMFGININIFKCIHLAIANATGVKHTCCICGSCRCSSRIRKRGCLKWNINQRVWRLINAPLSGHINDLIALKQLCQSQWRMTTSVQQMEKKSLYRKLYCCLAGAEKHDLNTGTSNLQAGAEAGPAH